MDGDVVDEGLDPLERTVVLGADRDPLELVQGVPAVYHLTEDRVPGGGDPVLQRPCSEHKTTHLRSRDGWGA